MKKIFSVLLAVMLLISSVSAAYAGTNEDIEDAVIAVSVAEADGSNLLKFGSLDISISSEELLDLFSHGDIVTIVVGDLFSVDVPVCSDYNDVDAGELLLRAAEGKSVVTLARSYGQIAEELGMVEKAPEGSEYAFRVREDATFPIPVTIIMKEQGGYLENLRLGALTRTNDIADYPELTEEEFANFRMVRTSGIAEGVLYRSSNPIDPKIGRNTYADKAAREAGIRTVVNLCDSKAVAEAYDGYAESYYSGQNITFLNLPMTFTSEEFRTGFRGVFSAIAEGEAPYLVHCSEGKDRAGFASAVIEALMGASADEIMDDYLTTYINYYDVRDGVQTALDEDLKETIRSIIMTNMSLCFGIELTPEDDLAGYVEQYLMDIGVTAGEIESVRMKLGTAVS